MSRWDSTIPGLAIKSASTSIVESEKYATIRTNVIPELDEVRLYEDTVKKVHDGHGHEFPAELPSVLAAVARAVQNPTHVEKSYGNSYVFVDAGATNFRGDPLRVPVKTISGTSGRVKTYYCASTDGEREVVYRRPDENV